MNKRTTVWIIILFFILVAGAAFISYLLFEIGSPRVDIPRLGYLDIPLAGPVREIGAPDFLSTVLLGAPSLTVHDFWMNLRKAEVDPRVRAVLLRSNKLLCDWAKAAEIRESIRDFRRSGKKVYAYIEEAPEFDMEYYIATACDRIILHPLGWLGINGLGGYVPFLKEMLDKIGLEAEFEHVEEYKTASHMFTEKGFTPAHREEMDSVYSDLFAQYVETAAEARGKSVEEFRTLLDRAFFQGEKAKEAGLVDECLYEDEVQDLLRSENRRLARIRFSDYTKVKPVSLGLQTGRKIALIYGVGTIMTGESLPEIMGGSTVARWIRSARSDTSIAAIVFRIDSPGGSSVGSDVIWREIQLAGKQKPVVVSMSDLAGSGGYWVALAARKIVAQPQTLTGSIGVLAGKFSLAGLYEKLGVTAEKISFGDKADIFSTFRPFTAEERKILKEEIRWTYDQFLTKAAEGRNLTREDVDKVGKGRVWTGRQAKGLGLVDELGGLTMAIGLAKELAGIPAEEDVRLVVQPKKKSLWQTLFGGPGISLDLESPPGLERIRRALGVMGETRIWALMPFWTEVVR
jgi:protease-4